MCRAHPTSEHEPLQACAQLHQHRDHLEHAPIHPFTHPPTGTNRAGEPPGLSSVGGGCLPHYSTITSRRTVPLLDGALAGPGQSSTAPALHHSSTRPSVTLTHAPMHPPRHPAPKTLDMSSVFGERGVEVLLVNIAVATNTV